MGRSQQRKGAAGEAELARILNEYGFNMVRGGSLSFGAVPDLVGLPGIHIECKRVERLNIQEAMDQAIRDSERFLDGMPVVFHRRNRQPWLVTMRLTDFMKLYGSAQNNKMKEVNTNGLHVRQNTNGSSKGGSWSGTGNNSGTAAGNIQQA